MPDLQHRLLHVPQISAPRRPAPRREERHGARCGPQHQPKPIWVRTHPGDQLQIAGRAAERRLRDDLEAQIGGGRAGLRAERRRADVAPAAAAVGPRLPCAQGRGERPAGGVGDRRRAAQAGGDPLQH
ncbi:MAG: hypothetical protein ACK559_02930, partial [bacterium]